MGNSRSITFQGQNCQVVNITNNVGRDQLFLCACCTCPLRDLKTHRTAVNVNIKLTQKDSLIKVQFIEQMGLVGSIDVFEVNFKCFCIKQACKVFIVAFEGATIEHIHDECSAVVGFHVFCFCVHVGYFINDAGCFFWWHKIGGVPIQWQTYVELLLKIFYNNKKIKIPLKSGLSNSFLLLAKKAFLKAKSQQACIKCTDVTKSSLQDKCWPFKVINKFHINSKTFSGVQGNDLKKFYTNKNFFKNTNPINSLLFPTAMVFVLICVCRVFKNLPESFGVFFKHITRHSKIAL